MLVGWFRKIASRFFPDAIRIVLVNFNANWPLRFDISRITKLE